MTLRALVEEASELGAERALARWGWRTRGAARTWANCASCWGVARREKIGGAGGGRLGGADAAGAAGGRDGGEDWGFGGGGVKRFAGYAAVFDAPDRGGT